MHRLRALPLSFAALCLAGAAPAMADPAEGAWTLGGDMVRVDAAGLDLPLTADALSLSKSGEFSDGGRSIDNYAQYVSADGAVQATVYVYLPTYADAALAAYMTDKAVMARFGERTRRTTYDSVAAGGRAGVAIRARYEDAADGQLVTAGAFLHVGRWLVKIRITGPTEQKAAVFKGLDVMLAKLRFDDPAALHAAAAPSVTNCPAPTLTPARIVGNANQAAGETDSYFPHDGRDALCISGTVETKGGPLDMLRPTNAANGPVIVPMDDSGTVMAFDPTSAGYRLSIHSVGQTDVYTLYDRLPNPAQIAAILDGTDPATAKARSTAAYAASGEITVSPATR